MCRIISNQGKEFENQYFIEFCQSEGILHEFSTPMTDRKMVLLKGRIEHCKRCQEL